MNAPGLEGRGSMDATQRHLVHSHIAALEAEAAAERLAAAGRARAQVKRPSLRHALGHRLMTLGASIAAVPLADDPCPDVGAAHRA